MDRPNSSDDDEDAGDIISLLIVEDQAILRIGIKCVVEQLKNVRIAGIACDGPSAVQMAKELEPELILMDIGLPGCDGLEAMRQIKETLNCRFLMLTSHADSETVCAALQLGAHGYCVKGAPVSKMHDAINSVAGGAIWLDEKVSLAALQPVV